MDTLKCHYHESFTFSFFFTSSNKDSIYIAFLGVSATASLSSLSGLVLVSINKNIMCITKFINAKDPILSPMKSTCISSYVYQAYVFPTRIY